MVTHCTTLSGSIVVNQVGRRSCCGGRRVQSTQPLGNDRPRSGLDSTFWQAAMTAISPPVLICLLGNFFVLKLGQPVRVASGGKAEGLFCILALQSSHCISRDTLLSILWPKSDPALAAQSLNSLVYTIHKQLGDAINGAAPVLHSDGLPAQCRGGCWHRRICFRGFGQCGRAPGPRWGLAWSRGCLP